MIGRSRVLAAVDRWTAVRRSRYAADVFLSGRPRRTDGWVSAAVFELQARRWQAFASDADHVASFRAGLDALALTPRNVLDIGTGAGVSARLVADRWPDAQVMAVDMSRHMVRRAKALGGAANLEFRRATALRLPIDDGTVDTVVALNAVVELGELGRVTSPTAQILMASTYFPLRDNGSDWLDRWASAGYTRVACGTSEPGSWEIFTRF